MSRSDSTGDSTNSKVVWLKPEQVEAMRDAAYQGGHGARDDALLTLLYDTGLRRSEAAALDRSMLDLDDGQLRIPGSIQKDYPNDNSPDPVTFELDRSGDLRTVRTLRSYLDVRESASAALFPSQKSDRMSDWSVNAVVQRAARRADVRPYSYAGRESPEDVSAHTLRHSVAWRMLRAEEGNTLYDVRNRLRHATILTTERKYDHFQTV